MNEKDINCEDLVLGDNVTIEENVKISGGKIVIGDNTVIRSGVKIDVSEIFSIGKNSLIKVNAIIRGRDIQLGREFYTNHYAEIGGGSCFEKNSQLRVGYWFYLGSHGMINTAMAVKIGNEVGLGRFTNIYTHGVYLSVIDGYPVKFAPITIGDRVWIPSATINPGVTIGNDVVIGVGSLVNKDIPTGTLAIGFPCKIIKENYYPRQLSIEEKEKSIIDIFNTWKMEYHKISDLVFSCYDVIFDFQKMELEGKISKNSERARNILRRNGIRFKVETDNENYEPWKTETI